MDMALMFLPSETLYFEAIRDGRLWEDLSRRRVFLVSPNTLAITLRGIAVAQDYYEMARSVEKTIEEVRKAQRHFGLFEKRFEDLGKGLGKAQEAFATAQLHLSRYSGAVVRLTGERPEGLPSPEEPLLPLEEPPGEP
jgi:DNA recombination protein RmuC